MRTNHSPCSFLSLKTQKHQFNHSLCSNIDYTTKLKNHLKLIQKTILKENMTDEQMIWECIKYQIRKFSIKFSKQYAKDKRTKTFILEKN